MAIPSPATFRANTSPTAIKIGALRLQASYGGSIAKVLAALESYWDNRNAAVAIQEGLLYNLWKQSSKWLKLKSDKIARGRGSDAFLRRKVQVETLCDEALAELARISPAVARALGVIEERKQNFGPYQNLVSLKPGYALERKHYLKNNKREGAVISASTIDLVMGPDYDERNAVARKLRRKGFGNISLSDAMKLQRAIPDARHWSVVYQNKIARLQYLVTVSEDGLLCDIDGNALSIDLRVAGGYVTKPYVIDKYGNLFMDVAAMNAQRTYVGIDSETGGPVVKQTDQFNHSSFVAGTDVLCAGCLHVGYDCRRREAKPGVLSAIDNSSGHYKPDTASLRAALEVLAAQGVDTAAVRVSDWSLGGDPQYYWAIDFMHGGMHPWPDYMQPSSGFLEAPPIRAGV